MHCTFQKLKQMLTLSFVLFASFTFITIPDKYKKQSWIHRCPLNSIIVDFALLQANLELFAHFQKYICKIYNRKWHQVQKETQQIRYFLNKYINA